MRVAKQFKYPDSEQRKPPVPRPNDRPVMGLRTTKDYVTQNAVENIQSVARRPDKTYVDTRRGDKHSLIPSGLEPVYLHKKVSHLGISPRVAFQGYASGRPRASRN